MTNSSETYYRIVPDYAPEGDKADVEVHGAVLEEMLEWLGVWKTVAYIMWSASDATRFKKFEEIEWIPEIQVSGNHRRYSPEFCRQLGLLANVAEKMEFPIEDVATFNYKLAVLTGHATDRKLNEQQKNCVHAAIGIRWNGKRFCTYCDLELP